MFPGRGPSARFLSPRRGSQIETELNNKRIWELDAFRGFAIICVVIVHTFVQLEQFGGREINLGPLFWFIKEYCGSVFVVLSGICVTLSNSTVKTVKRGALVFFCGLILTGLTEWLYLSGREDSGVLVQWGALHLIGFSMLVYPLLSHIPVKIRFLAGAVITCVGLIIQGTDFRVLSSFLFPIGFISPHFTAMDYFPLMPEFGWFLIGSALGTWLYASGKTRLPQVDEKGIPVRILSFFGRHSLLVYMIHQPLLYILIKK